MLIGWVSVGKLGMSIWKLSCEFKYASLSYESNLIVLKDAFEEYCEILLGITMTLKYSDSVAMPGSPHKMGTLDALPPTEISIF